MSPEFAVRVRQQIEAAPARPRWFGMFDWRWAVPVAAAVAIAAFVLSRGAAPTTGGVEPAGVQARGPEPNCAGATSSAVAIDRVERASVAGVAAIANGRRA